MDETDIGRVRVGDSAAITSDAYRGTVYKGRVKQIADYAGLRNVKPSNPAVNLGLKVVQVKIELLEPTPFRLGMSVDVKITPGKRQPFFPSGIVEPVVGGDKAALSDITCWINMGSWQK